MKKKISSLYMGLVFLFLYAPVLVMIVLSFNETGSSTHKAALSASWNGFTLRHYLGLFSNKELLEALLGSFALALLAAFFASLLGTAAALGLNNVKKGRGLLMNLSNLPMLNPEIVTGVSLMLLYIKLLSMDLGFVTVLISHTVFNTPYVILNVLPRLRRMDKNLYEAALDLGCPPGRAFAKVVIPEIFPGIFAGFLISLTYSLDDYIISSFTGGDKFKTLSVFINDSLKFGVRPWMAAMTGVIFLVVLGILLLMNLHDIREEKAKA